MQLSRRIRVTLIAALSSLIPLAVTAPVAAQADGLGIATEGDAAEDDAAEDDASEDGASEDGARRSEAPDAGTVEDGAPGEGGLGVDTETADASDAGAATEQTEQTDRPADDAGEGEDAGDDDGTPAEAVDEPEPDEADVDAEDESEDDAAPPAGPTVRWNEGTVAGWAIFFVSLGVGVGGAVLVAIGADDVNSIENAPGGTDWDSVADAYERAPILTGVGAATLGVGVAGLAVGAVLLAINGEEGTWLEGTLGPGTIGLRGRF